jgi:plastocyanin
VRRGSLRVGSVVVALASVVIAAGCSDENGTEAAAYEDGPAPFERSVTMSSSGYHPAKVRVLVGGSITFVNHDPTTLHSAETFAGYNNPKSSEDYTFNTRTLTWEEPYTIEFHNPGTYTYFCAIDGRMQGEVEVVMREPPR